jgi:6-phosphogluconate dehydrogenase (decarboxylating)
VPTRKIVWRLVRRTVILQQLAYQCQRWTIKAAIDEGVPVPVLTTALYERFSSRGDADFQDKLLSAMRYGFGGHLEKSAP